MQDKQSAERRNAFSQSIIINMKSKSKLYAAAETAVFFIIVFFLAFGDVFYSFDNILRDRLYQTPRGITIRSR